VNGTVIESPVVAQDGDLLGFPGGASVRLELRASEVTTPALQAWLLAVHGRRIGLRHAELVLGGGDDDVMIECWPPAAAKLTWRDDRPYLVPQIDGIQRAGTLLAPHVAICLEPRDQLTHGGRTIEVLLETVDPAPTARAAAQVTAISLEQLSTGGLVTITTTRGEHRALLAERRFALVHELLAPLAPYAPGQFIPDELIFERVWPRHMSADRGDLNQLVFRLRADLRAAGLTEIELIERNPKGGAVRALVDATVVIQVRT
jgi:hypothetical protein